MRKSYMKVAKFIIFDILYSCCTPSTSTGFVGSLCEIASGGLAEDTNRFASPANLRFSFIIIAETCPRVSGLCLFLPWIFRFRSLPAIRRSQRTVRNNIGTIRPRLDVVWYRHAERLSRRYSENLLFRTV